MRYKITLSHNFQERVLRYVSLLNPGSSSFKLELTRYVNYYKRQGYSSPVETDDPNFTYSDPVWSEDNSSVTLTRTVPYSASTDEIVLSIKPSGLPIHPSLAPKSNNE